MSCKYLENVLPRQGNSKMSCRYLENVLSRQDNSKTILRCLEDVLCRLGKIPALMSIKISPPPIFHMRSSHTSSIAVPLSPSIPPHTPIILQMLPSMGTPLYQQHKLQRSYNDLEVLKHQQQHNNIINNDDNNNNNNNNNNNSNIINNDNNNNNNSNIINNDTNDNNSNNKKIQHIQ